MIQHLKISLIISTLIVSRVVNPNPLIIKLSKFYQHPTGFAVKFLDQGTFIFGKFIEESPSKFDVYGVTLSFEDFKKQEKETRKIITRDGVMYVDISSSYEDEAKEYNILIIGRDVIKIVQGKNGSYFTVQLLKAGKSETRKVGIQVNSDLTPKGIPYIYEPDPQHGTGVFYPSFLWIKKKNESPKYLANSLNQYEWQSQTADQNYELIISDKDITKHFDILFGEGLLEYIIKRNAEEIITDERVFSYRQMQTLILSSIICSNRDAIMENYPNTFDVTETYKRMELIMEHPGYMKWYDSEIEKITEKLKEFRDKLPKK